MVKPTLLQSLLGQPSQSYHVPTTKPSQRNVYYNSIPDVQRAALVTGTGDNHPTPEATHSVRPPVAPVPPHSVTLDSDSEDDVFYTPYSSPRHSIDGSNLSYHRPESHTDTSSSSIPGPSRVNSFRSSTPSYSSASSANIPTSIRWSTGDRSKRTKSSIAPSDSVSTTIPKSDAFRAPIPSRPSSIQQSSASQIRSTKPRRAKSVAARSQTSLSQGQTIYTSYSRRTHNTVDIPEPLPLLGPSALGGYSQLVLPKASYVPTKNPARVDGRVDLISSGKAQTTMACIEIQQHSAVKLANRRSFRFNWSESDLSRPPGRLPDSFHCLLAFANHLTPPTRVSGDQVLVQVWAVAVDGTDGAIVEELSHKTKNAGFVPGRSFVGRVIETGYTVSNVSVGDWTFGLTDLKCGALKEFIVIDKRRLNRAPVPTQSLGVDELSLLPLCGVPSRRAMVALTAASIKTGSQILVLNAHHGSGALVLQQLVAKGLEPIAHIPPSVDIGDLSWTEKDKATSLQGDVLPLISRMESSSLDAVIDTVGGHEVWEECRRVLRDNGSFVTLVGESATILPSISQIWKSNLRSLRSTFIRSESKLLRYTWVSVSAELDVEGQDVHATLANVAELAEARVIRPLVRRAVPFEQAAGVFPRPLRLGHSPSEEMVVQLIGN